MPYNAIPYHTLTYNTQQHTLPYHANIHYHTIPYVPYHTLPRNTIHYHTMPIYITIPYLISPYIKPYHIGYVHYLTILYLTIPYLFSPYHTPPYFTAHISSKIVFLLLPGSSTSFDGILAKLEASKKRNGDSNQSLVDYIKTTAIPADQCSTLTPTEHCQIMKTELLHKLDYLASYLPTNTLDQLMDDLGGPDHVAEVALSVLN